jgi:signal transduction histidine kinase
VSNLAVSLVVDGDEIERYAATFTVDEAYDEMAKRLVQVKETLGVLYVYIFTWCDETNELPYIFDSEVYGQIPNDVMLGYIDELGYFPEVATVLQTGRPLERAVYYKDSYYDELYYMFSPIFNSSGEIVAIIGTDIDVATIRAGVVPYVTGANNILIVTVLALFVIFILIVRHYLTKPLTQLTKDTKRMSEGVFDFKMGNFANRRDELGQLAQAFNSVSENVSEVLTNASSVIDAMRIGDFKYSVETDKFKGDFHRLLNTANQMLVIYRWQLDAMPEPIGFFNKDFCYVYGNIAMVKVAQEYDFKVGSPDFLPFLFRDSANGTLINALKNLSDDMFQTPVNVGQQNFNLSLHRHTTQDDYLVTLTDVTTLIQSKNEALAASKAKSVFLSKMSHEIFTPLNTIIGTANVAKNKINESSKADYLAYIDRISSSSAQLLDLLSNIMNVSKLGTDNLIISEKPVSLNDLLDFVIGIVKPSAEDSGIKLNMVTDIRHNEIMSDPNRLRQVLMNLLSNSIRFSAKGGTVNLTVNETENNGFQSAFMFSIKSDRFSLSNEELDKLLAKDTDDESSTIESSLWLSISSNIVEMMGGELIAESEAGKACEFSFTLSFSVVSEKTQTKYDFSGMNAIVADDVDINRMIVTELCDETNINITEAVNGKEAYELFRDSPIGHYSIIIMDVQMPEMNGYEATKAIRELNRADAKTVRIAAMSASSYQEDIDAALDSGMNSHIAKPVDADVVFGEIEKSRRF